MWRAEAGSSRLMSCHVISSHLPAEKVEAETRLCGYGSRCSKNSIAVLCVLGCICTSATVTAAAAAKTGIR
jgi:hypothetical protein